MHGTITIDVALWGLVVGTILPIVVGLVTDRLAASWIKTTVLLFLAAVIAVGQEILTAGSFELKVALLKFALLFLTSVGTHFGLLKPTGVTGADGAAAKIAPRGLLPLRR